MAKGYRRRASTPPRDPQIEKEIAMGQELCRSFTEKFGQSTIDKCIPTATVYVFVHDIAILYFSRYLLVPGCSVRVRISCCCICL
jgi:hypothetical protein